MDKKITIRDVAREAGVSIATVSYVLNNRFDQKISANTRKKVLQIANLLQFTPSYAAKLLTTGKSHNIGILSGNFSFFDFFHIRFIKDLISVFADKGYKTTILPSLSVCSADQQPNIDGIVCIDLTQEQFLQLSDNCLLPIVCADMIVDHYLFFQIYNDYSLLLKKAADLAQYTFLHIEVKNEKYKNYLCRIFGNNICFCQNFESVQNAVKTHPAPFIAMGDYLTLAAMTLTPQVLPVSVSQSENLPVRSFFELNSLKKAETVVQAMFDAIERNICQPRYTNRILMNSRIPRERILPR